MEALHRHLSKARFIPYLIMASLAVSMAYSLHRQGTSSMELKVIEAGLIESGGRPALYFDLTNTGEDYANCRYVVAYNRSSSERRIDTSGITVPPGRTFSYTISLTRPSDGVMVLDLKIYGNGEGGDEVLLHDQTWIIRAHT